MAPVGNEALRTAPCPLQLALTLGFTASTTAAPILVGRTLYNHYTVVVPYLKYVFILVVSCKEAF